MSFELNIFYFILIACLWISEKLKTMCYYYSSHPHQRERTSHTKDRKRARMKIPQKIVRTMDKIVILVQPKKESEEMGLSQYRE